MTMSNIIIIPMEVKSISTIRTGLTNSTRTLMKVRT